MSGAIRVSKDLKFFKNIFLMKICTNHIFGTPATLPISMESTNSNNENVGLGRGKRPN